MLPLLIFFGVVGRHRCRQQGASRRRQVALRLYRFVGGDRHQGLTLFDMVSGAHRYGKDLAGKRGEDLRGGIVVGRDGRLCRNQFREIAQRGRA